MGGGFVWVGGLGGRTLWVRGKGRADGLSRCVGGSGRTESLGVGEGQSGRTLWVWGRGRAVESTGCGGWMKLGRHELRSEELSTDVVGEMIYNVLDWKL